MKLLVSLASPFGRKVRIVLAEKRIECDLGIVDLHGADNPVSSHNPLGKIPTLLLDNGTALYDSRVIVEFLDNISPTARLIPEPNRDRVAVRRWEALADGVLDAGVLVRYEGQRPKQEQSADWTQKQMGKVERGLAQLAHDLGDKTWCHGEKYSLADIAFGCCLGWLEFRRPGGIDWRASFPSLVRHYEKLMLRPAFAETVPQ
jgi:glutathione S-transferase